MKHKLLGSEKYLQVDKHSGITPRNQDSHRVHENQAIKLVESLQNGIEYFEVDPQAARR
jgi:hypothetical protein